MSLFKGAMIDGKILFENEDTGWQEIKSELSSVSLYGYWRIKNGLLFINVAGSGSTTGNVKPVWFFSKHIAGYGTKFKIDSAISVETFEVNANEKSTIDYMYVNTYTPDTIEMQTTRTDSRVGKQLWVIPLEEISTSENSGGGVL